MCSQGSPWREAGTTEERSKVNRMLEGRQVYQVEGRAGREEVWRSWRGAGVEREEPYCFRAGCQVQRTPQIFKGRKTEHILGNGRRWAPN